LKASNSGLYNPALSEFSKLCINAISGKVTEGLHLDQTKIHTSEKQVLQLVEKYDDITFTHSINGNNFI